MAQNNPPVDATKHQVFIIHGMGVHEGTWVQEFIKPIEDASKRYAAFQARPLEAWVQFQPLGYDHIPRAILRDWKANLDALRAAIPAAMDPTAKEALERMDALNPEDNFFWSHVMDVLLWRINPPVWHEITSEVALRIAEVISELLRVNPSTRYSVIAHSLGTSVIHDTLQRLALGNWDRGPPAVGFDPAAVHFASIHMVANVSRVLERRGYEVYQSRVRPGPASESDSYCLSYFNFAHRLDPITIPKPFQRDWPTDRYHPFRVSHLDAINVHDFAHYLGSPTVHIPILRSITAPFTVTAAEEAQAHRDARDQLGQEAAQEAKARLRKAAERFGENPSIADLLSGLMAFASTVEPS